MSLRNDFNLLSSEILKSIKKEWDMESVRFNSPPVAQTEILNTQPRTENPINGAIRRLSAIAIPIIALEAMSMIPTADSGPVTWASCVASCEVIAFAAAALTGGILTPVAAASLVACTNICWAGLAAPTP